MDVCFECKKKYRRYQMKYCYLCEKTLCNECVNKFDELTNICVICEEDVCSECRKSRDANIRLLNGFQCECTNSYCEEHYVGRCKYCFIRICVFCDRDYHKSCISCYHFHKKFQNNVIPELIEYVCNPNTCFFRSDE